MTPGDPSRAADIVAGWKRRLLDLAQNSPVVFVDTPQHLIEQYRLWQTTFIPYSEREVANCEAELGVRFPLVFREYLLQMGHSPGDLFRGSERAHIDEFDDFRRFATRLLYKTDPQLSLPRDAVVFMSHQGYTFLYILATGGFDGPVMQWNETRHAPRIASRAFADLIDSELRLMEHVDTLARQAGGTCLKLSPGGEKQVWSARRK